LVNGTNATYLAARFGHLDIVKYLVEEKLIDTKAFLSSNHNILHISAQYGNLDVVKYIVDKKLMPIGFKINGSCILHVAAQYGHLDIVKYIVDNDLILINMAIFMKPGCITSLSISLQKCIDFPENTNFINIAEFLLKSEIMLSTNDERLLKKIDESKYNSHYLVELIRNELNYNDKIIDDIDFSKLKFDQDLFLIKFKSLVTGKCSVQKIGDIQKHCLLFAEKNKVPKELIDKASKFFEDAIDKILFLEASLLSSIYGFGFQPLPQMLKQHNSKFEDSKSILEFWIQLLPEYKEDFETFLKDGSNTESFITSIRANAGSLFAKILKDPELLKNAVYKETYIECLQDSVGYLPDTLKDQARKIVQQYQENEKILYLQ
jgi:hypothetical protein